MKRVLTLILVGFFVFGCTPKGNTEGNVIAKVNNAQITKEDFMREMSRIPDWAKERFSGKEGKEQFLDELIKRELLYQEAERLGLSKDKEFLEKVEEFKRMTLLSTLLKKEVEDKAVVAEAEIKEYYDKHPQEFRTDQVRASHILVEKEDEAKAIIERLKKGEDFSKIAESLSKDPGSASRGGDLGFFGRGRMIPEFEEVAFSLKPGEVSQPLKTRFGYHIIKVTEKKEGDILPFEQVKDKINNKLISEKQRKLFESLIERLTKDSKIEKKVDDLDSINIPQPKN
ncbi:MAG: peptidylprolyl isomerase [Thermodesulfovibrionia bacterium]